MILFETAKPKPRESKGVQADDFNDLSKQKNHESMLGM